ncbi:MAG: hypothetical protein A49_01170 [Methyloceanibacter sp.]|nr:MAG: hypothetical protein A49_01170 [Methyloceanibacter sp.]
MGDARQRFRKRLSHFVDAPDLRADPFGEAARHRPGSIEDDHGVFRARGRSVRRKAEGGANANPKHCDKAAPDPARETLWVL